MKIVVRVLCTVSLAVCASGALRAEEDPSYQPFNRVPLDAQRKASPSVDKADKSRAPVVPNREPSSYSPAPSNVYVPQAAPAPVAESPVPAGPRVKYILNGKPVYEGDPDPIAEAKARAASAPQPAGVRLDYSAPVLPRAGYGPYGGSISASPPSVASPAGRTVKYILNGKPIYEGDPDPIADAKARGYAPAVPTEDFSASAVLARSQGAVPAYAPAAPVGLIDDLTADKAVPGVSAPAARDGGLVLEEFAAPGPVNSKAKKCYAALANLKKNVEAISRYMDNRGRENARLIHASESVLNDINELAAQWPASEAFMDVCAMAKRSALVFNNELSQEPWTWTRVRWSYDAMVKDVKTLRSYSNNQALSEPKPQMIIAKDGTAVYVDASTGPAVETAEQRREASAKSAREELTRIKESKQTREERRKTNLPTDLDGN